MRTRHLLHPMVLPRLLDQRLHGVSLCFVHENVRAFDAQAWFTFSDFVGLNEGVVPFVFLAFTGAFALDFLTVEFFQLFFGLFA